MNRDIKGTKTLKELIVKNWRCLKHAGKYNVQPPYTSISIDEEQREIFM